jgi:hypothetical protein
MACIAAGISGISGSAVVDSRLAWIPSNIFAGSFRRFPPISAGPSGANRPPGGYTEAPDIVDESRAPDSGKGVSGISGISGISAGPLGFVLPAAPGCQHCCTRPPVRRARAAVAIEPST